MIDKPSPSFEMALQEEFKRFYLAGIETGRRLERDAQSKRISLVSQSIRSSSRIPTTTFKVTSSGDKIKDASDGSYDSDSA